MEEGIDLWKGEMATVLFKHLQVGNTLKISPQSNCESKVTLRTISQPSFLICQVKDQHYLREG